MPIGKEKGEIDLRQKFREFFFHMFPLFYSEKKRKYLLFGFIIMGNLIWFNSSAVSLHVTLLTIFQVVIHDLTCLTYSCSLL